MAAPDSEDRQPVRVLCSFWRPRPTTNPYIVQLAASLEAEPGLEVTYWSWRAALLSSYDVVHLHWPEIMFSGRTWAGRALRRLLTLLFCLRLAVTRTPVVRTWHNLERPSGLSWSASRLLDLLDRLTTLRIRLNDSGPMPTDAPYVTIPHGHYRDWYTTTPSDRVPGRVVFVGRIRRYKGVETLIEAFREVDDPGLSLHVAGLPSSEDLVETINGLVGDDTRISTRLEYVDDETFVEAVTSAELVVLPYRHMHNSGTVLAALSLDRPVLVPDTEVNRRLGDEVGPGWIHVFTGDLGAAELAEVGRTVRGAGDGSPDLSAREWDAAGRQHAQAYRRAVAEAAVRPRLPWRRRGTSASS